MKRLLAVFTAIAAVLFGATKLNLIDVRPLANGPTTFYMLSVSATGAWTPVIPDPGGSVFIDTSVTPAVIKAASGGAGGIETMDDFTVGAGPPVFTSSQVPKSRLLVFRNGLLQRPVFTDYTQSADATGRAVVTMPLAQPGDGVVLSYQR